MSGVMQLVIRAYLWPDSLYEYIMCEIIRAFGFELQFSPQVIIKLTSQLSIASKAMSQDL